MGKNTGYAKTGRQKHGKTQGGRCRCLPAHPDGGSSAAGHEGVFSCFRNVWIGVKNALRDLDAEMHYSKTASSTTWTFSEYAAHYVGAREAAGDIQERTVKSLRVGLKALGNRIGGLELHEITPAIIEAAYADLRKGKSPSGKPLSGRTLYNVNLAANLVFQHALDNGILSENPLDKVATPKKDTAEKGTMPAAAYRRLLLGLDPTRRMPCAVLLCAALGLRRSESIGLSWSDLDFAGRVVDIHASVDDHGRLKEPKTAAGCRLLPMPDYLASSLMLRKEAVVKQLLVCAPDRVVAVEPQRESACDGTVRIGEERYDILSGVAVVCDRFGARPLPDSLSRWWGKHRGDFGLEGWTLHGLRHSFLSLAAAQGVHPSVMQRLAGHQNPNITMKIYTHVDMSSKRKAMDIMQAAYMPAA